MFVHECTDIPEHLALWADHRMPLLQNTFLHVFVGDDLVELQMSMKKPQPQTIAGLDL